MRLRFILFVLMVFLLFAACGKDVKVSSSPPDKQISIERLVTKDAAGFIYCDAKALFKSNLIEDLFQEEGREVLKEFERDFGIKAQKSVKEVMFVLTSPSKDGYLVFTSPLGENKILSLIMKKLRGRADESEIAGKKFYHMIPNRKGKSDFYVAFPDIGLVIFAKRAHQLHRVLSAYSRGQLVRDWDSDLSALIRKIDRRHLIWGIFIIPEKIEGENRADRLAVIRMMERLYFGGSYSNKELSLEATVYLKSEKDAKIAANMLTGFRDMAKINFSDTPELIELYEDLKIKPQGGNVRITWNITKAQVDKVKAALE